jgi:Bacterial Ig-like domain (group 2)
MKRTKFRRIGVVEASLTLSLILIAAMEIQSIPVNAGIARPSAPAVRVADKGDKGSDFLVSKIEISPRWHSLNPCEEKQFGVNVKNSLGKTIKDPKVSWESTNPNVAKVDENGLVVGVNPGYTFIRALDGSVKSNVVSVFVREKGTRRC